MTGSGVNREVITINDGLDTIRFVTVDKSRANTAENGGVC